MTQLNRGVSNYVAFREKSARWDSGDKQGDRLDFRANKFCCMVLLSAGILALSSCRQLPSHISIGNKVSTDDANARFEQCSMSVRFSGSPRPFSPHEMSEFEDLMTEFAKWEVDGLWYERYRLAQGAICICRDHEITETEIAQREAAATRTKKDYKFIRGYNPPRSRRAFEVQASLSDGIKDHVQILFPIAAPRCVFVQFSRYDESTSSAATAFLNSYESPSRDSLKPALDVPKRSVADRLQELHELRRGELITEKEYEQKRKAILDGL